MMGFVIYDGFDHHSYTTLRRKKPKQNRTFLVSTDLTLLSFLSKDVTDQRLLKNFLFDQEMPKTSGWEGLVVLCPEKEKIKKNWQTLDQ